MARGFLRRLFRKRRSYPVRRDASGRSARRRAFDVFDKGGRPSEAAPIVGIPLKTACRYYQSWKKLPRALEDRYRLVRGAMKRHPEFSEKLLKTTADQLGLPLDELKERLEEPWGLKRLMAGTSPEEGGTSHTPAAGDKHKQWRRFKAAMMLLYIHEIRGVPGERILEELEKLDEQYYRPKPKQEEASDGP